MSDCRKLLTREVVFNIDLRPYCSAEKARKDPSRWFSEWAVRVSARWAGFEQYAYWHECNETETDETFQKSAAFRKLKKIALQELNNHVDMTADILDRLKR